MAAPELETARLTLCAHRLEDLDDCAAMWADPNVVKYIGGRTSTRQDTWFRLLRYVGHWSLMGYGYWVLREKTTGRFVGEAGFADFKREWLLEHGAESSPEAGWALASWAHGAGFATEAVREILRWGDLRFGGRKTICTIDPANVASIRVAEKCGYSASVHALDHGTLIVLFERLG
jgi:RimJ/RimL family protein N-acetyltransferase